MKNRLWASLLAAVLVAAFAFPIAASHINEPTAPIESVELLLYKYRERATTQLTACDNTETYTFDAMRIEALVHVEDDAMPSEHFNARVVVRSPSYAGQHTLEWKSSWRHQNVPPHSPRTNDGGWELTETEQWKMLDRPGTWRVEVRLVGSESGRILHEICTFQVAPPD